MSQLLLKYLIKRVVASASPIRNNHLYFSLVQTYPFSSSSSSTAKSFDNSLNGNSFTVNYLINSCGLTPERAVATSKYVKLKVGDDKQPDSVLALLKDRGFTQSQISKIISRCPNLLLLNPHKTLLPKFEFFKSKGFSDSDITLIVSRWPDILLRSLQNQLIPSFDYFSDLLQDDDTRENNIRGFKHRVGVLLLDLQKHGINNVETLKQAGVPIANIGYLLASQPRTFATTCHRFKHTVDEVTKMGFNPLRLNFLEAVQTLKSMKQSTWDEKVEVYKKWGLSDKDVAVAFRTYPGSMMASKNKIDSILDFLVDKMKCKPSCVAVRPEIIGYSLKKRIEPRCEVYQALVAKGLVKPSDVIIRKLLRITEKSFLENYVDPYKEEAPEILDLYKQKSDLAK